MYRRLVKNVHEAAPVSAEEAEADVNGVLVEVEEAPPPLPPPLNDPEAAHDGEHEEDPRQGRNLRDVAKSLQHRLTHLPRN